MINGAMHCMVLQLNSSEEMATFQQLMKKAPDLHMS